MITAVDTNIFLDILVPNENIEKPIIDELKKLGYDRLNAYLR